jgi:allantoicase
MTDFTQLADLVAERLGGRVLEANDEFFAPKENLLKESKPVFIEGKYTSRGKWMDGWETRRRRTPGHDWCIIRLGLPGIVRGIVVDTSFFTGNYPERFSLEGGDLGGKHPFKNEKGRLNAENARWTEIIPETQLKGNTQNLFPVESPLRFTHLRLRIYPDGGVARLRVHGEALPDKRRFVGGETNLVAVENGGSAVASSDQHYGAPRNLLMPYRAENMGDGWETKRRRGPGHDWAVLKLGMPGTIHHVELDTTHFKGNYPDSCSLDAADSGRQVVDASNADSLAWRKVLPQTKLKANSRHIFRDVQGAGVVTHVRLQIYPDGGVSRLRIFGKPETSTRDAGGLERLNQLQPSQAIKGLLDCCGSRKWAAAMAESRPFATGKELLAAADKIWEELKENDWLEAFHHHPPIGGRRAKAKQSSKASGWSSKEQSLVKTALPGVLAALAEENRTYAKKFGYVFLICAAGKTSDEILISLRQRLSNLPEAELRAAAEEQRKITRLRLEKLLAS